MLKTVMVMSAVVALLALLAWLRGGLPLLYAGLFAGVKMLWDVLPMLVAAFAVSGLLQAVADPEKVGRMLGKGSGWRGMLLGALMGAVIPGGPYVYYPVAFSFQKAGAEIGTIMTFIVARSLWDLARLPMEIAILGGSVTLARNVVTLAFPLLAGLLARYLAAALPGAAHKGED